MPPALGGQNLNPQTTREMPSSLVSKTVPPPDLLLFSACPISVSLSPGESFALRFIHRSVIHSRDFNCRHLLRIHLCLQYRLFLKPQTPVNRCLLNISRLCTNPALTELTNPGVLGASLDVQCLSPSPPPAGAGGSISALRVKSPHGETTPSPGALSGVVPFYPKPSAPA